MSQTGRHWIGTLAAGAAAGLWSLQGESHGAVRLALAVLSGACLSVCLIILTSTVRERNASGPER